MALAATHLTARAQVITPVNPTSPVVTSTVPTTSAGPLNDGGKTATDGYDFFNFNPPNFSQGTTGGDNPSYDVYSLPSYVTGLTTTGSIYVTGSPQLTIAGTTYADVGELYATGSSSSPVDFVTFELTGAIPTSFNLGVLSDYNDSTVYSLSLYSGNPSSGGTLIGSPVAISDGTENSPTEDKFYYGEITGASTGDYVVVSAAPPTGSNQVTLGGITFDTVATTPEPGTCALMFAGLGMLVLMARLRRHQA